MQTKRICLIKIYSHYILLKSQTEIFRDEIYVEFIHKQIHRCIRAVKKGIR